MERNVKLGRRRAGVGGGGAVRCGGVGGGGISVFVMIEAHVCAALIDVICVSLCFCRSLPPSTVLLLLLYVLPPFSSSLFYFFIFFSSLSDPSIPPSSSLILHQFPRCRAGSSVTREEPRSLTESSIWNVPTRRRNRFSLTGLLRTEELQFRSSSSEPLLTSY